MGKNTSVPVRAVQSRVTDRIFDIAQRLAQTRGFNGFSYADIAAELAITKASVHYHFPAKADLGRSLIARYHLSFGAALDVIDRQTPVASEKLRRYVALYDSVLRDNRFCLCGMFAAEYSTLPAAMQEELRKFFDQNEIWLAGVLKSGRHAQELAFSGSVRQRARSFMMALEGAMLVARAFEDPCRFASMAKLLLADLAADRFEVAAD